MKIAICDDESQFRNRITEYANEYFSQKHLTVETDEYQNGTNLLNSEEKYDIVFLDIELGDVNGIEVAKVLQKKHPATVFLIVTSYRQYLDDAMDINVLRYIDKPVSRERIFSSLDRALKEINESEILLHGQKGSLVKLKMSEIIYIEAKLREVNVYTENGKYKVSETLKQIKQLLTADCFAVPHNSFIVNLNYISKFQREQIVLLKSYDSVRIPVATRKQAEFRKRTLEFFSEDN